MPDNTDLWDSVCKTDPKHVKPIKGKAYTGNSPKPYYLYRRATETFGPCGIGWGYTILEERIENSVPDDKGHFDRLSIARVKVWYEWQGKHGEVEHVGGTPFAGFRKNGDPYMDEDAVKKSVTDALVKALSMIGFAGDIFMGRYDDCKYLESITDEFRAVEDRQAREETRDRCIAVLADAAALGEEALNKAWFDLSKPERTACQEDRDGLCRIRTRAREANPCQKS